MLAGDRLRRRDDRQGRQGQSLIFRECTAALYIRKKLQGTRPCSPGADAEMIRRHARGLLTAARERKWRSARCASISAGIRPDCRNLRPFEGRSTRRLRQKRSLLRWICGRSVPFPGVFQNLPL